MKRFLLASAVLCGVAWAVPAGAQIPVSDSANLVQQAKDYVQYLKSYATQVQQYVTQAQQLAAEIQTLESFVQNPNLGTALAVMQVEGLTSALPVNPYTVQSLVSGAGGLSGTLGALSSMANGSFGGNSVYQCTDNSWACQQVRQRAAANANQQGIAMNALQTLADHQTILQLLRNELANATTPAQRENLMAAIQTETAWSTEENTKIAATNIMVTAQQNANNTQAEEKLSRDLQNTINSIPK